MVKYAKNALYSLVLISIASLLTYGISSSEDLFNKLFRQTLLDTLAMFILIFFLLPMVIVAFVTYLFVKIVKLDTYWLVSISAFVPWLPLFCYKVFIAAFEGKLGRIYGDFMALVAYFQIIVLGGILLGLYFQKLF